MDDEEREGLFIGEVVFNSSIFPQDIWEFREALGKRGYTTYQTETNPPTYEIYKEKWSLVEVPVSILEDYDMEGKNV